MSQRVPAVKFSHFGFAVHDLKRMEAFYRDSLGFTVTDRGKLGAGELVFLSRDPTEHHQIVLVSGRPENTPFNVINQISFRICGLDDLRRFYDLLPRSGASEIVAVTHGNAISLYCRDPEGNRIELYFDTPWYCSQPCREPIDLNASNDEIMEMTGALVRKLPGFKPRAEWEKEMRDRMEIS